MDFANEDCPVAADTPVAVASQRQNVTYSPTKLLGLHHAESTYRVPPLVRIATNAGPPVD